VLDGDGSVDHTADQLILNVINSFVLYGYVNNSSNTVYLSFNWLVDNAINQVGYSVFPEEFNSSSLFSFSGGMNGDIESLGLPAGNTFAFVIIGFLPIILTITNFRVSTIPVDLG